MTDIYPLVLLDMKTGTDSRGTDRGIGRGIETETIIVTVTVTVITIVDVKAGTVKGPSVQGLVEPTLQDQGTMKKK
jgi:hypothetical protein